MALIIGLTGGIGCGKSSAARLFAQLGAGIIDTDEIAHRLTQPGQSALTAIAREFGPDFLLPDGSLDRARLRQRVFSDAAAKQKLEAILHPLIRQQVIEEIGTHRDPYLILVVPLLFETGAYHDLIQRILVVDCAEASQIERTKARSKLSDQEVRAIMACQVSRAERLAKADDVLPNQGNESSLATGVAQLHQRYLELSELANDLRMKR